MPTPGRRIHSRLVPGNRGAKGNKFEALQAILVRSNNRKIDVRIARSITVARKMFRGCQRAVFFHAAHEFFDEFRHSLRVFSKRPRIDDGIAGIIVYVGIGRVDPVNADGASLESCDFAHEVGVAGIAGGRYRHRSGE